MLTRIGVGLLIALALDPLTNAIRRGSAFAAESPSRSSPSACSDWSALAGRRARAAAVEEAGKFSDQLRETIDELEELPLVGGYLRDNEIAEKAQEWVRDLPEQFTDERVADDPGRPVSGVVSVAIVVVVAIVVLIDGENMLARTRRLLTPARNGRRRTTSAG